MGKWVKKKKMETNWYSYHSINYCKVCTLHHHLIFDFASATAESQGSSKSFSSCFHFNRQVSLQNMGQRVMSVICHSLSYNPLWEKAEHYGSFMLWKMLRGLNPRKKLSPWRKREYKEKHNSPSHRPPMHSNVHYFVCCISINKTKTKTKPKKQNIFMPAYIQSHWSLH